MNINNFDKIVNELVELASEGKKSMLVNYNLAWELSISETNQEKYIDDIYVIGTIDLEAYNTFDDIKEEVEFMLFYNGK